MTPACAADSEFFISIAASILTSDCSGFSNFRAAHAQQPSASNRATVPMKAAGIHGASWENSRRTTNKPVAPIIAVMSRGEESDSSHHAKFTVRATRRAFDCQ